MSDEVSRWKEHCMLNDTKAFMGKHFELINKDHKCEQVAGMDISQRPSGSQ